MEVLKAGGLLLDSGMAGIRGSQKLRKLPLSFFKTLPGQE
jgi:hypothetical protein